MADFPPVRQDLVASDWSSRDANSRAIDRVAPTMLSLPMDARSEMKPPQFAVTLEKLREAFFYRWKLALTVGLILAAMGAALGWHTYADKFTALGLIRMSSSKPRLLPTAQWDDASLLREEQFQKRQIHLLKATKLLDKVVFHRKEKITSLTTIRNQEDPVLWLQKELQANFLLGTDILAIKLTGEYPDDVQKIVGAVMDEFRKTCEESAKLAEDARLKHVNKAEEDALKKIKEKQQEYRRQAEGLNTGDPQVLTLNQKLIVDEYAKLIGEQAALEAQKRQLEAKKMVLNDEKKALEAAMAQNKVQDEEKKVTDEGTAKKKVQDEEKKVVDGGTPIDSEKVPEHIMQESIETSPAVQKAKHEVERLKAALKKVIETTTELSTHRKKALAELDAAESQLATARTEAKSNLAGRFKSLQKSKLDFEIYSIEAQIRAVVEQHKQVAKLVREKRTAAEKVGSKTLDFEMLGKEIESDMKFYSILREQKERLKIESSNEMPIFQVVQEAQVPTINQGSYLKTYVLFTVAGFLLGCIGVSYLEARLHRVHKRAQVPLELGIPTLGTLPLLAPNSLRAYGKRPPTSKSVPDIMFADAVDGLCARLLCDDRLGASAVLMVTSASEDEGKTMVATQLAVGLARSGRRTLLIDCDFRNPRCHHQFALTAGPGLSEVLCGEAELANVMHQVPDSEARILPAGQSNPEVIKALINGNFASLLTRLRQDFDYIIVDSAPTPIVSDGLLIGKLVDGVIMMVRLKVSKAPAVFAAYEQLSTLKIRTLGAVVNAETARVTTSYYKR